MNLKTLIAVALAAAVTAGFAMPKHHETDRPSQVAMLELGD
jgi:hypothetical protein